jgi:hypothetical protein
MHIHKITCDLSDVPEQFEVKWSAPTQASDLGTLNVDQGTHSGTTQKSVLTLTSEQMVQLKAVGLSHQFTCKIEVGSIKHPEMASQTLTIFTPGKLV